VFGPNRKDGLVVRRPHGVVIGIDIVDRVGDPNLIGRTGAGRVDRAHSILWCHAFEARSTVRPLCDCLHRDRQFNVMLANNVQNARQTLLWRRERISRGDHKDIDVRECAVPTRV